MAGRPFNELSAILSGKRRVERARAAAEEQRRAKEAEERREAGQETLAKTGSSYNVSGWTIARLRA